MSLPVKISFLFCLFWGLHFSQGFNPPIYQAKNFTLEHGLPSNAIYCIFKDSRGIVWIGTENGLVKYDGKSFKIYNTFNGLIGNLIWDIQEDKNHHLWFACYNKGLSKFDGTKFTNYTQKDGLVNPKIRRLFFDKEGKLYIGTNEGLSILYQGEFYNLDKKESTKHQFDKFQIMQFWEEDNHVFLLSRTHYMHRIVKTKKGFQLDSLGKNYKGLNFDMQMPLYLQKVAENTYMSSSEKIQMTRFINGKTNISILDKAFFWNVAQNQNDYYLACNGIYVNSGGLMLYQNGQVYPLNKKYGIHSNQIWSVYFDAETQQLYVGSMDNGLYIIDLKTQLPFYKQSNLVDYLKAKDKEVLLFTDYLVLKKGKEAKTIHLSSFENEVRVKYKLDLKKNHLYNIGFYATKVELHQNKLYVLTNVGIFILLPNGKLDNFIYGPKNEIGVYNESKVITTHPYGNVYEYFKKGNQWKPVEYAPDNIRSNYFFSSSTQIDTTYYFLDKNHGVYCGTPATRVKKIPMFSKSNKRWVYITSYKNQLYLVSDEGEIVCYLQKGQHYQLHKKWDHRHYKGVTIQSVEIIDGKLVILSNAGLNIISNHRNHFLDKEQGLFLRDFIRTKTIGNELAIIQKSGYYLINISKLLWNSSHKNHVRISNIQMQGKKPISDLLWHKNIKNADYYPYHQNNFTILLELFEYSHPKKMNLSYSFDKKNWIPIDQNKINVQSLSSGKYSIFIKQEDYFHGQQDIYPIYTFEIGKPFWLQWWFILSSFLGIALLVAYAIHRRIRKVQQLAAEKEFINKRIAETKLEALQSQMNPHFIFNALTAIQSYVLDHDIDNTLMYMNDFSRLIRQTLEFSSKTAISIKEERDYIERFVKIENLRFGDQVSFQFLIHPKELIEYAIPPMLIQPLIENAFEHAFTIRRKPYQLIVQIEKNPYNEIEISVKDNGEGFKHDTPSAHESKALKIIAERLQLLDETFDAQLNIARSEGWTIISFKLSEKSSHL